MLSDFSPPTSNLDFLKTSDESNAVKLNRTLGPGMWFDCDKHSSQNLEYFLVCDIFYNDSDIRVQLIFKKLPKLYGH